MLRAGRPCLCLLSHSFPCDVPLWHPSGIPPARCPSHTIQAECMESARVWTGRPTGSSLSSCAGTPRERGPIRTPGETCKSAVPEPVPSVDMTSGAHSIWGRVDGGHVMVNAATSPKGDGCRKIQANCRYFFRWCAADSIPTTAMELHREQHGIRSTLMAKQAPASTRLPRGTKPVAQAFLNALDTVPEQSRAAVSKAALSMIRDEIKASREKQRAARSGPAASAKTTRGPKTGRRKRVTKREWPDAGAADTNAAETVEKS
jgi:hypothetical protein